MSSTPTFYKIDISAGILYHAGTKQKFIALRNQEKEGALFAVNQGILYVASKVECVSFSIFGNVDMQCAGELSTNTEGNITSLSNRCDKMLPNRKNDQDFLFSLYKKGCTLGKTLFDDVRTGTITQAKWHIMEPALLDKIQNDPERLYEVADAYAHPKPGTPVDLERSIDCFKRSAELNHPAALHTLGCLYLRGEGVSQSQGWL